MTKNLIYLAAILVLIGVVGWAVDRFYLDPKIDEARRERERQEALYEQSLKTLQELRDSNAQADVERNKRLSEIRAEQERLERTFSELESTRVQLSRMRASIEDELRRVRGGDVPEVVNATDEELTNKIEFDIAALYPTNEFFPQFDLFKADRKTAEKIGTALTEVKTSRTALDSLNESLSNLEAQRYNLLSQVDQKSLEIGELNDKIFDLNLEIGKCMETVSSCDSALKSSKGEIDALRKKMSFSLFRPKFGIYVGAGTDFQGRVAPQVGAGLIWAF